MTPGKQRANIKIEHGDIPQQEETMNRNKNYIIYQQKIEMPPHAYGRDQVTEFTVMIDGKKYIALKSYNTIVAALSVEDQELYIRDYYSSSTSRHIGHWVNYEIGLNTDIYYSRNRRKWNRATPKLWRAIACITSSR